MREVTDWPASRRAWDRAQQSLAGGVSTGLRAAMRPHPIFFSEGHGSVLTDVDGNNYIDYVLGWGPLILGHSNDRVVAAVGAQLRLGQTFGAGHHWEYDVAEQVCAAVPGVERVLWSNTGTEAVQVALRLARAATGRQRFLKFEGHYHGWADPVLISYQLVDGGRPTLTSEGQSPGVLDDIVVVPWNDVDRTRQLLAQRDVAAVLCEPVLCNSGLIPPADGFLQTLRSACDATGTVLVFDEVITGFRVAYGGAVERYGVNPDLVILGKAIGGGFPLSAVAGRADILDQVTGKVVHAGTFNGNPIVLSAASATLAELRVDGVYDELEKRARLLAEGFAEVWQAHGAPAAVRQVGPVVQCVPGAEGVGSLADFLAGDWSLYDAISVELLRRGVFVLPRGRWYLSTAHSERDVADTVAALDGAVAAALRR